MPTTWTRTPEEFHKIYTANTDAFYRLGGSSMAKELDEFMTRCALNLWSRGSGITQRHVDMANQLYSRGQPQPKWLLWSLTNSIVEGEVFLPPVFYWNLAESDAKRGTEASRTFIRMLTNILLYLAAVDDDVTYEEAAFITECTDKLNAICDTTGVRKSKEPLNPLEFVTSGEPSFIEKNKVRTQTSGGDTAAKTEEKKEEPKPDFDTLMAELNELVGLDEVKRDIKNLVNLMKVRKLREANDLPVPPMSLHMVFLGNPGTGKTTVARIVSGLYAAIGVLEKGQLVEVDRSGLVAGYVGQTALKTQEVIKKSAACCSLTRPTPCPPAARTTSAARPSRPSSRPWRTTATSSSSLSQATPAPWRSSSTPTPASSPASTSTFSSRTTTATSSWRCSASAAKRTATPSRRKLTRRRWRRLSICTKTAVTTSATAATCATALRT